MPPANRVPGDLQHLLPLTPAVLFILFALAEGEKHGYAIMQTVSRISDNQFRMGPGTLYTTIQRLLDLDLIEETDSAGGQSDHENSRRYYKLTQWERQSSLPTSAGWNLWCAWRMRRS